ncbi:MAG: hypothetical protein ACE5FM_02205 [Methyloligellaceae bacterium]
MTGAPNSSATERPKRVKLPFWRTIGQAYVIWASNLAQVIRISWLWLLLMAPVLFALSWLLIPFLGESTHAAPAGEIAPRPDGFLRLAHAIDMLVRAPMLASIAVAWHRLVLRDERVTQRAYLRLDRVVLVYAGFFLFLVLLPTIPQYVIDIYAGGATDAEMTRSLVASLLILFLAFAGLYAAARLSIVLPARALERNDITLGRTWKETQGNGWRLLWGHFLCTVPIAVMAGAGSWWLLASDDSRSVAAVGSVLLTYIAILGAPIAVGFLSLAYRHFLEE